jgi:hypothetical protein
MATHDPIRCPLCAAKVNHHGLGDKPLTCPRCRHRFDAPEQVAQAAAGVRKPAPDDREAPSQTARSAVGISTRKPKPKPPPAGPLRRLLYVASGVLVALLVSYGIFRLIQYGWGGSLTIDDVAGYYVNEKDPAFFLVIDARGLCRFEHTTPEKNKEGYQALLGYKIWGNTLFLSLPEGWKDERPDSLKRPRAFLANTSSLTVKDSALVCGMHGRFLRVEPDCLGPSGSLLPGAVKYGDPRTARSASGKTMARPVNPVLRAATSWTAVSADGSVFVAGLENGCIGVWDPSTGQPIAGWESNFTEVRHPCLSPDGNRLAFTSEDGHPQSPNLRVMNPRTGEFLNQPVLVRGVPDNSAGGSAMAYSPDGDRLVVNTSQGMKVLDGELGTEQQHVEMGRVGAFVLLPEGDICVALCGLRGNTIQPSTLAWCNLETGSADRRLELPDGREYERLTLSTDGNTLALFSYVAEKGQDRVLGKGLVELRNTLSGEVIGQAEVPSNIGPFAFISGNKNLMVVQAGGSTEWDVASATLIRRRLELPVTSFGQISSPANRLVAVIGRIDGGGPKFFDLTTGKEIAGTE